MSHLEMQKHSRLGHAVAEVGELHPGAVLVRSALRVEFRVVHEHARLGHVLLVVGGLLGVGVGPDLLVLRLGEAGGNVRLPGEGAGLEVLLRAGAVFVRVGDGGPEVEVGELGEEGRDASFAVN